MSVSEAIVTVAKEQEWTEPVAEVLQTALDKALPEENPTGLAVRDFLHGTWLGHPLHPVLTDIPVGAWTTAVVLDAVDCVKGQERHSDGADAAIAVGLVGAACAATAGLADWSHSDGGTRRMGVVHAALNIGATALFATSLLLRRRGARAAGRGVGFAGFATLLTAAYLGGELVYREYMGVDHSRDQAPPEEWTPALPDAELREGEMRCVEVGCVPILLTRVKGEVRALINRCSHLGGPLSEGKLRDGSVVCPWHGSRFSLEDGRVLNGPAAFPQPVLQTRIREGQIEVRTPNEG